MGRLRAATLLLAAIAAGLLLAACGSDGNSELLPGTTAKQIESNLDQVRSSVSEQNCEAAEDAVAQISTEIDELQKVDVELKAALKQGAAKLSEVVSSCGVKQEEAEQVKAEEEEKATLEAEEEVAAEEAADEKAQKAEEREDKAKEKAEKHAEQPGPSDEGEQSGKGKGQEEAVEPPAEEEVPPPGEGGGAGGIGPGAEVEGAP